MANWTGEKELADATRWAFEYERGCFSKEHKNWPDFRENREQSYMSAWCHGAPGIGLSRLGALHHSKDPWLREEIDIALETTVRESFGGGHCLCHGDMGNLETLVTAAEVFRDPHWLTQARRFAGGVLDQAKRSGWVCGNTLGVESPGLMTGIAGIGYELLRLAASERVPSVLALELPRKK
jgi:lantibiotic modifying enzyme